MKRWSARSIGYTLTGLLLIVGLCPVTYLYFLSATHNVQPLSMPLPLAPGDHPSGYFKTDQNIDYLVQLSWDGRIEHPGRNFDIDWRVIDDHNATVAQGTFAQPMLGNAANLGSFHGKRGRMQRIILSPRSDQTEMAAAHPILTIGDPEASLDMGYGKPMVWLWMNVCLGIILVGLLTVLCIQRLRPKPIPSASG
jgi:hypothetical protein